jgi:hypothetical protein
VNLISSVEQFHLNEYARMNWVETGKVNNSLGSSLSQHDSLRSSHPQNPNI